MLRTTSSRQGRAFRSWWWLLIAAVGLLGIVGSLMGAMWAGFVDRDPVAVAMSVLGAVVARWWMAGAWVRYRIRR
jgi:hypothetical protein